MGNFEPVRWRHSHFHHHSYTIFNHPVDFEIPVKNLLISVSVFLITYLWNYHRVHESLCS